MAAKKSTSKKRKKNLSIIFFILTTLVLITAYYFYSVVFQPNINTGDKRSDYIYIPTGSRFNDVVRILNAKHFLKDEQSFIWLAGEMQYKGAVKPGRYLLLKGMNNRQLIRLLRSGNQVPVRITFSNIRTVEQLAGIAGSKLEADSASILFLFRDDAFQKLHGFNAENSLSCLIPDTYEFFWNTSAEGFYKKLFDQYKKFWNNDRLDKCRAEGLSPVQVSIIASIVEQETHQDSEKPVIAGVYINRYKKGWKLEADPTLVYALGDFSIHRVLNEYKLINSPYNTYMYGGLPPGPICMPSRSSMDAVLNYSKHNYFYFCAKEDFSGYHSFAKSYEDHLQNARKFQKELNKRGIRS